MVEDIGGSVRFVEANAVQQRMRLLAGTRPMAWLIARVLHRLDFPMLRRSTGRHSVSSASTGAPVVELTTIGARSSQPRMLPIIGVPGADRLVLVPSDYGQQCNPGWYYNLKADPQCPVAFRYETEAYDGGASARVRRRGALGSPRRSEGAITIPMVASSP